jgi:hypothetical protein
METKALDLSGIPEPIARGLEIVAQMARSLLECANQPVQKVDIPIWSGTVLCPLDRDTIYD